MSKQQHGSQHGSHPLTARLDDLAVGVTPHLRDTDSSRIHERARRLTRRRRTGVGMLSIAAVAALGTTVLSIHGSPAASVPVSAAAGASSASGRPTFSAPPALPNGWVLVPQVADRNLTCEQAVDEFATQGLVATVVSPATGDATVGPDTPTLAPGADLAGLYAISQDDVSWDVQAKHIKGVSTRIAYLPKGAGEVVYCGSAAVASLAAANAGK